MDIVFKINNYLISININNYCLIIKRSYSNYKFIYLICNIRIYENILFDYFIK